MTEPIWARENHPLAPAGPDTPRQQWESSGAYPELGGTYYDPEPEPEPDPDAEPEAGG